MYVAKYPQGFLEVQDKFLRQSREKIRVRLHIQRMIIIIIFLLSYNVALRAKLPNNYSILKKKYS